MNKIVSFGKGIKTEFKKIVWPSADELAKKLLLVVTVSAVLGVLIVILDYVYQFLLSWITTGGAA